ncbi:hypothetical protein GW17_00051349 [Ensete ventricosum]|nr:hypothetical protein GW17_00051349 [Ensete ventricosum]
MQPTSSLPAAASLLAAPFRRFYCTCYNCRLFFLNTSTRLRSFLWTLSLPSGSSGTIWRLRSCCSERRQESCPSSHIRLAGLASLAWRPARGSLPRASPLSHHP